MSNIIYNTIDATYPVAGQDNDTQGFRDNFSIIKTGLGVANTEITSLETRAVLTQDILLDPVDNNLLGSTIRNGVSYNIRGKIYQNESTSGTIAVVTTAASLQIFTLVGNTTFKFSSWPTIGEYAKIRLLLTGDGTHTSTVTFIPATTETLVYSNNYTPITVSNSTTFYVIDVWCYDGSDRVFIDYQKTFTTLP